MEIKNKISPAILSAATAMLQQYVPDISPTGLLEALRTFKATEDHPHAQRPYTRREVMDLLKVSLPTINRMMNAGTLRRIHVGERSVRIAPESVNKILHGGAAETTEA